MTSTELAVIGGSGLVRLFDGPAERVDVHTPYGSVTATVGEFAGRRTAFLPRHGDGHTVAPHLIAYRANIWALASLGVRVILSSSAVGSLTPDLPPGTLALTDQIIDRTTGRASTFFDRGEVHHLPAADPFDPALHVLALEALRAAGEDVRPSATVVVIDGPRFATRAESRWHAAMGGELVNMTMAPEVFLASELGLGTVNLAFVTDMDAGIDSGDPDAASQSLVFERLAAAQPRIVAALATIAGAIPPGHRAPQHIPADAIATVLGRTS
ncbi:MTAP family purine nucleoside phosphorylase [Pseudolysinimonas sp.]|uniref:MTAP family purine nucleoside phosphorylase n=1 Tax=Pseudolysinimonas sp. TaxID=2680009 RepID=UPI003F7CFF49